MSDNQFYANEAIHLFLDFIEYSEGNKYIFKFSFYEEKREKYRFMQIQLHLKIRKWVIDSSKNKLSMVPPTIAKQHKFGFS